MNDFTKEELKIILCEMNIVIETQARNVLNISPIQKFFLLRDKIQSMLDDYCEHAVKAKAHEWSKKYTCMKCRELIE